MKSLLGKTFALAFIPLLLILMSASTFGFIFFNQGGFGSLELELRATIVGLGLLSLIFGCAKLAYKKNISRIFFLSFSSSLVILFLIFFAFFSSGDDRGLTVKEISNQLVTDSSSNGYVEVGFGYPIYTVRLKIKNDGLFTKNIEIFFKVLDQSGEEYLYRAVRGDVQNSALSVESAVRVILSESADFLFNPISIPPFREIEGNVAFIISNVDDGADFVQQFSVAQSNAIELRDEISQELIQKFAVSIK